MKELSIEEKAKAYDEALVRANEMIKDMTNIGGVAKVDDIQYIFPELKESEDEKIRKNIIATIHLYYGEPLDDEAKEMIAWLENKGEKKLILPKWKYKKDNTPLLRDSLILNKYGCVAKSPSGALVSDVWVIDYDELAKLPKEEFEKQGEQKPVEDKIRSIYDAKDGDVLCTYECDEPKIVFILKGTPKKHYALSYHCYYNIMYPHFDSGSKKGCLAPNDEDVKPATKEQRDLLFQKMKEAGYEWDAEKKELKKMEQKPAWSEEDENRINRLIAYFEDKESFTAEDDVVYANWLKSLKDRYTWKPSKEQMEALHYVTNFDYGGHKATLVSLYEQLKKLRG